MNSAPTPVVSSRAPTKISAEITTVATGRARQTVEQPGVAIANPLVHAVAAFPHAVPQQQCTQHREQRERQPERAHQGEDHGIGHRA